MKSYQVIWPACDSESASSVRQRVAHLLQVRSSYARHHILSTPRARSPRRWHQTHPEPRAEIEVEGYGSAITTDIYTTCVAGGTTVRASRMYCIQR